MPNFTRSAPLDAFHDLRVRVLTRHPDGDFHRVFRFFELRGYLWQKLGDRYYDPPELQMLSFAEWVDTRYRQEEERHGPQSVRALSAEATTLADWSPREWEAIQRERDAMLVVALGDIVRLDRKLYEITPFGANRDHFYLRPLEPVDVRVTVEDL